MELIDTPAEKLEELQMLVILLPPGSVDRSGIVDMDAFPWSFCALPRMWFCLWWAIFAHLHNWSNVQHTHRIRRLCSASRWCSERWLLLARYQDDLSVATSEAFSGNTPVSPVVPRLVVMPNLELTCSCLASQF